MKTWELFPLCKMQHMLWLITKGSLFCVFAADHIQSILQTQHRVSWNITAVQGLLQKQQRNLSG